MLYDCTMLPWPVPSRDQRRRSTSEFEAIRCVRFVMRSIAAIPYPWHSVEPFLFFGEVLTTGQRAQYHRQGTLKASAIGSEVHGNIFAICCNGYQIYGLPTPFPCTAQIDELMPLLKYDQLQFSNYSPPMRASAFVY